LVDDPFELTDRAVCVSSVRTEAKASVTRRLHEILPDHEQRHAAEFHTDRLRQSFIIARAALRLLLGRYLDLLTKLRYVSPRGHR